MHYFSVDGREFYSDGRLVKVCGLAAPWYEAVEDPEVLVASLKKLWKKLDIFTFFQRVPHTVPRFNYYMEPYSVAVIKLTSYEDWWNHCIGKYTRQAIKKSQKCGVEVRVAQFDDEFVKGVSSIWNETPIRMGKKFPHYQKSLERLRKEVGTFIDRSVFLGAYYGNELIGYMKIVFEDDFADVLNLLSKISHREKSITNALLDKGVRICCERDAGYLAYGDWDSSGLGDFKRHNGFSRMDLPRYYIPLNRIGEVALRLRLHRRVPELLPVRMASFLKNLRRKWNELRMTGKQQLFPKI